MLEHEKILHDFSPNPFQISLQNWVFFISVVAGRSPSTLHSSLRWRSVGGGIYSQYFVKHSHLSSRKEKDLWLNPRKWMNLNWARICRPFKEPRNRSQPGRPVGQPYLSYRSARLHRLAESIPRNRFLGSIPVYKPGLRMLHLSHEGNTEEEENRRLRRL